MKQQILIGAARWPWWPWSKSLLRVEVLIRSPNARPGRPAPGGRRCGLPRRGQRCTGRASVFQCSLGGLLEGMAVALDRMAALLEHARSGSATVATAAACFRRFWAPGGAARRAHLACAARSWGRAASFVAVRRDSPPQAALRRSHVVAIRKISEHFRAPSTYVPSLRAGPSLTRLSLHPQQLRI